MKLIWTLRAADQLERAAEAIEIDRPAAARKRVERILNAVDQLPSFPLRGRRVLDFTGHAVRELVIPPYRILYEPASDHVTVLSIKHSREELSIEDLRPDYP